MKKLVILSLVLLASACEINYQQRPISDFSMQADYAIVGEEIEFLNYSKYADYCEWDFGDGCYSDAWNPVHTYSAPGSYRVRLTVSNFDYETTSELYIDVLIPTSVRITVKEYSKGYPVPDASVLLYPTLNDWDHETNALVEGITDKYGVTEITNLEAKEYYVDVWHQYFNNYALADEDVGFIRIPRLVPHKVNEFVAWVDYVDPGKKKSGKVIIRRLEPITPKMKVQTNVSVVKNTI